MAEIEVVTGWRLERVAKAGRAHPDAVTVIDGKTCFIEMDNSGKMTAKMMQAKWRRYAARHQDCFILVVAMTEKRMQRLRADAETVKEMAFFTTLDRLRSAKEPWIDCGGESLKL